MPESQPDPLINSYTSEDISLITFNFHKDCYIELRCIADHAGEKRAALTLNNATAKEVLVHLQLTYGMEDWECAARLSREQFEFLNKKAEAQEMTMEDVIRQLIQEKIDREES